MTPYIVEKKLKQLAVLILITTVVSFIIQAQHAIGIESKDEKQGSSTDSNIRFKIIPAANYTWGYDIYLENELTIHQPTIPGLPGNEGFKTKEAAQKVAELVVEKMKKGEMPPTVTEEELKKLKAI